MPQKPSEVSFTELQSLQALRHLESLALQSFELRCVAAPLRCAESLALLEGQRSLVLSGTKDSMFLTVPDSTLCPVFTTDWFGSRTHLRTLQLWFVSLPGKGPGVCLVDRIMGRSGF